MIFSLYNVSKSKFGEVIELHKLFEKSEMQFNLKLDEIIGTPKNDVKDG